MRPFVKFCHVWPKKEYVMIMRNVKIFLIIVCCTCLYLDLYFMSEVVHTTKRKSDQLSYNEKNARAAENIKSKIDRSRRILNSDYDEWKDEAELMDDYDKVDDSELTLSQKLSRNWKKVAIRCIFLGAFLMLILMCCRCWCATSCPFILSCVRRICCGWTDICCKCFIEDKDPIYEKVKALAKNLGIELTEETYDNLLQMCEDQGMEGIQYIRRK